MIVAQVGDSAVIVAVGQDGSLWFFWQPIDTKTWHPEPVASTTLPTVLPVTFSLGSPSVAQVGDSAVIAAVSQDSSLWFFWQAIGTGTWHPEQVPTPVLLVLP